MRCERDGLCLAFVGVASRGAVSVRRAGMLGCFAVSVRRAGMLGCFAVSVRGVMSCG